MFRGHLTHREGACTFLCAYIIVVALLHIHLTQYVASIFDIAICLILKDLGLVQLNNHGRRYLLRSWLFSNIRKILQGCNGLFFYYYSFLPLTPLLQFWYKTTWHVFGVGTFVEFLIMPTIDAETSRTDPPCFTRQAYLVPFASSFQIYLDLDSVIEPH